MLAKTVGGGLQPGSNLMYSSFSALMAMRNILFRTWLTFPLITRGVGRSGDRGQPAPGPGPPAPVIFYGQHRYLEAGVSIPLICSIDV
jgi:hypothetical protein